MNRSDENKEPNGVDHAPRHECEEKDAIGSITQAACILLAADPNLSPHEAVQDAYQVYAHVRRLQRIPC